MQIPQPPVVGQESVARRLRTVLFSEPIIAATYVWPPRFFMQAMPFVPFWVRAFMNRRKQSLPMTLLCLAVTPVDIRLFAAPSFGNLYEIGRWRNRSYAARIRDSFLSVNLDLDVDGLGRITLAAFRTSARVSRPVFDLVVQSANGPVI